MKTVIIGGVAAGMSAASKLRRLDPGHEIVVLERGGETSYGACGLPYYISGLNPEEDLLRIRKPEAFIADGIDLRLWCEVTGVDSVSKTVRYRDMQTGWERAEAYDHLVVATGADAVVPGWAGEMEGVFTLKTIPDARRIQAAAKDARRAVVVGSGYIGLEMAESFLHMGLDVDLIEVADRALPSFDAEFSRLVEQELAARGVGLHLGETVTSLEGDDRVRAAVTDKGRYPADIVLAAVGLRPNTAFLRGTGVELLPGGAVRTDRWMRSSVPGIWAAGDCAGVWHRLLDSAAYIPLATNANKQGRYLAENILGGSRAYDSALGSAMIKVCSLELARTGLSEAQAAAHGIECVSALVESRERAPYYPGGDLITIKLTCRRDTGAVIGAQLAGRCGVALRADVLAACITAGMTAGQVGELDFGYAPPYAMPWDVLHVAANMAESKRKKEAKERELNG